MKNLCLTFSAIAALFLMIACSEEEKVIPGNDAEATQTITFEVTGNTASSGVISKAFTPSYPAEKLQIYAYKLDEGRGDYYYSKSFTLSDLHYIPQTKTWRGNAPLEAGTYKFLPTYGLNNNANISLSPLENQSMNSIPGLTYSPSKEDAFPEIFLPIRPLENFRSYQVNAMNQLTETVRDTVSRAVSRVDVMFIKARKEGNTYIEESYATGRDIFGQMGLGRLQFRFGNISNKINLLGQSQAGLINATVEAPYLDQGAVTVGTSNTSTIIGNKDYFRFDSIQTNDIIQGSAHVFGTYLLPDMNDPTASLQLYVEPLRKTGVWTARTINIIPFEEYGHIPFEQNKVTLIKVYVLRGDHLFGVDPDDPNPPTPPDPDDPNPPTPPVPPTPPGPDPDFGIEIEVLVIDEWDESHYVNQPIGD